MCLSVLRLYLLTKELHSWPRIKWRIREITRGSLLFFQEESRWVYGRAGKLFCLFVCLFSTYLCPTQVTWPEWHMKTSVTTATEVLQDQWGAEALHICTPCNISMNSRHNDVLKDTGALVCGVLIATSCGRRSSNTEPLGWQSRKSSQ